MLSRASLAQRGSFPFLSGRRGEIKDVEAWHRGLGSQHLPEVCPQRKIPQAIKGSETMFKVQS